jgi:hypothetical protein
MNPDTRKPDQDRAPRKFVAPSFGFSPRESGMIRSCVSWCRHLFYALVVLALLGCLTEIGLRVYDSATGQVTRRDLYDRGLVCKSWTVHHSLKPARTFSVRHPDRDERVTVMVNSFGLRGPEPALPRPAGVYRILCLGDELTFAAQTPDADAYCARLQQNLPERDGRRVEVLNAGVPDYCPLLSYLQMKHQLLGLQPDLVIVNFEMGDVADDYKHRRLTVIPTGGAPLSCAHPALEMPRRGGKLKTQAEQEVLLLPQWCRYRLSCLWAQHQRNEQSRSIDSPQSRFAWIEDQPPDWSVYIEQSLTPLAQLRDLVGGFGAELVVVVCPAPWQVSAAATSGGRIREDAGVPGEALYRSPRPFELVAEFCRAHHLACLDLSAAFQRSERPERLFLMNSAALSEEGHALYAQCLARFLEREFRESVHEPASPGSDGERFPDSPQALLPAR